MNTYVKYGALGALAIVVSDIVGDMDAVKGLDPMMQKVAKYGSGAAVVVFGRKFVG